MYGAPNHHNSKKMLMLGSGELGKEVVMEAQRIGIETIAVDRYEGAPAMQVAHRFEVIDMLDGNELRSVVEKEQPDYIVPEIEAIATDTLLKLEKEGYNVIPTAYATQLTMDREGIRRLASEKLGLPTAKYEFANSLEELKEAVQTIGLPCVIKPIMSSSGKGQSLCRTEGEIEDSWEEALGSGRGNSTRVIVEEFIHFDSEITLLTVQAATGTYFCPPIGHRQEGGDYIQSWQPHTMSEENVRQAEAISKKITDEIGGYGVFGVELFITSKGVYFSEVSPRPHDTGMVTMVTQQLSEFALHVRAILGLPIEDIQLVSPGSSHAVKSSIESSDYIVSGLEKALAVPHTQVRLFGKPSATIGRRMAVVLGTGDTADAACKQAETAASYLDVVTSNDTES
ncbi:phosphoribosylglycinamide formyltransferase 2 [Halobacillus halophilus]|uniref:Formate-dependent phosphoribosylglycinamide formyltransferase n=1 Tax=Halobacillus halophilus (strain ATCC 35676 / DSM 2266 / JCM 20832 / KCTC 3685 / LMG 17431 / NBRC 102448 / NCIMB 2269) TaxID=866895 RepID=I0JL64_HALH3|nr:formate-dependent phosphoribosylglycinamide formyltransferase [Halobacillus halophilus]ASF39008.1 phosphoribosylglycinamide formyltransferase 2 [Halobacillus halophilus]CCG44884.1 phosphoribosylglycinamide formyltransferase [Halobacillus halophilus DSM 2266]